jgi:hypothetical protein
MTALTEKIDQAVREIGEHFAFRQAKGPSSEWRYVILTALAPIISPMLARELAEQQGEREPGGAEGPLTIKELLALPRDDAPPRSPPPATGQLTRDCQALRDTLNVHCPAAQHLFEALDRIEAAAVAPVTASALRDALKEAEEESEAGYGFLRAWQGWVTELLPHPNGARWRWDDTAARERIAAIVNAARDHVAALRARWGDNRERWGPYDQKLVDAVDALGIRFPERQERE